KEGAEPVQEKLQETIRADQAKTIEDLEESLGAQVSGVHDAVSALSTEFRESLKEQRGYQVEFEKLQERQSLGNAMAAKSMEALAAKLDAHTEKLAGQGSMLTQMAINIETLRRDVDRLEKREK